MSILTLIAMKSVPKFVHWTILEATANGKHHHP